MNWTPEQIEIIKKVLKSDVIKLAIGADEWDLSEEEEEKLWEIIKGVDS
ncbi:hypothetical protein EVB68_019 [Rhizobium phage RHph_Y2_6]|uniref:Uncharacterized protein n=1 Tax=Rhizobium phage RHph_Y2_6 TaxID=2509576 RepID=A0A7S5QZ91_9CAUD|nr:hypothetical protein PP748_gp019 [Rhizobium phage RHph_Y2_6]QIG68756.1 hypothetical protein EVB68_019 [Rhizobium phage RHph_Y2_6]